MTDFSRLLVANRGEIALRVMQTARRMGLGTVAVFSDADEASPHVRFADVAVRLGPAPAAESYLCIDAVLRAARLSGADAIHPGYGFLAENPDFAQAVIDAGLVFVGPSPRAMRAMGLKREAKALVASRGVPLVPGSDGGDQSTQTLVAEALRVGLPVIFKPSAGGGGKGMHVVREKGGLEPAIEAARREARRAFGDDTLIIERFLERPRHVEVQVLGDAHGGLVHLFERECSLQRRHQKVVEESPSVALTPALREAMGAAAVEAARAVDYVGAGTVEFLLGEGGDFFFSEMNTRLQVEHRVTEKVVGVDLVELQLRVARGERLPFTQGELRQRGHAVECRLYAEDPAHGFVPSTGRVHDLQLPSHGQLLVDTALEPGAEVSLHYDGMLAKLVTWGDTRAQAMAAMTRALEGLVVQGPLTNRGFLTRLLAHPDVVAGRLHTGLIDEAMGALLVEPPDEARDALARVAATLATHEARRRADEHLPQVPSGWRNNRSADAFAEYVGSHRVEYRALGNGRFLVRQGGGESTWRVIDWSAPTLTLEDADGLRSRARVVEADGRLWVHTWRGPTTLEEAPRFPTPADGATAGGFMAPMPGKVVQVLVSAGTAVARGQTLLVLEAMKMEQTVQSPVAGTVARVLVREGDQVTAGQTLVTMAEPDAPADHRP